LRRVCGRLEPGGLADAQLLERFAKDRDEAAFEVLVWRHGGLVLGVCRRVLRNPADVEDVFQATFLTLVRKAGSIRRSESLAGWLYRVAYRIALRLRATQDRRARHERPGIEAVPTVMDKVPDAELWTALDDEVSRLPEKYRAAVVLCYLQGLTTHEAGRVLGCPQGTVLSRLAWARQRLRSRLVRRGLAPVVALAALESAGASAAPPSLVLVASVVPVALSVAAGGVVGGVVSSQVAGLVQGALHAMWIAKVKLVLAVTLVAGMAGTGAGWLALGGSKSGPVAVAEDPPAKKTERSRAEDPQRGKETDGKRLTRMILQTESSLAAEKNQAARQEHENMEEVITARGRLVEAEERLRQARRERAAVTADRATARLRARVDAVETRIEALKEGTRKPATNEQLKQLTEEITHWQADSDRLRYELERQEILVRVAEEKHTAKLIELRKKVVAEEERLRLLEHQQAMQREDASQRREGLAERLRQLKGEQLSAELPGRQVQKLERKLDALQRELSELRRELRRQQPEREK
jgi:RNA polymerase sigma factor (sigma-70 family)